MNGRQLLPASLIFALLTVPAGCTSEAPANGQGEGPSTGNVSLATTNESGVQGLVTVSGRENVTFKLELMGLTSGDTYAAALYEGSCESPGAKVADLNSATSGAIGIGSSVTSVPRDMVAQASGLHVQAHLPDGTLAACGSVPEELVSLR